MNLSIDFEDALPASEMEASIARITRQIRDAVPEVRRVFVEAEAWKSENPGPGSPTPGL